MTTKNQVVPLVSGINGENQARAIGQGVKFTRIELGDANNSEPLLDPALVQLINKVGDGIVKKEELDPNVDYQRIVWIEIPPSQNVNVVEMLLYAQYGSTEFPHSYISLAAPFPVRTIDNGGSQARFKLTTRVHPDTNFTVQVAPNISYVTRPEVDTAIQESRTDDYSQKSSDKTASQKAVHDAHNDALSKLAEIELITLAGL